MGGMVYCRWPGCEHSDSARNMSAHEQGCEHNPDFINQPVIPPKGPGHVASNHFLRQFDRYPEGEQRLKAMAAHAALLYNQLQDEKRLRLASYRDIVGRLSDASPFTELALSLDAAAREMEED